jgi:predicted SnoaL-like aldol condensation-catalyzing enzyme
LNIASPNQHGQSASADNKTFALMAFDTLFNKRDYKTAEGFWSARYIQHGDLVILHGRFSGTGLPANWIAADMVRLEQGQLMEHWDVLQDEATLSSSKSGLPMFGASFPSRA